MKRNFTLSLLLVFASLMVKAQLPDGSIAPNFTATDINGNEHTLYDVLDEGKSVVIDFMATWCGPCWSFHQTHATSDLYEAYGPTGSDEVVVFMIESDEDTAEDCIYGIGPCPGTIYGDWTEGVEYPVFNDHTIAPLFNVGYYPTIYHICPNRIVVEAGQVSMAQLYAHNADCMVAAGDNNVGLLEYSGFSGTFCGSTEFAPSAKFQNMGIMEMTSATFELWLNGSMTETMDWAGSLTTYQVADIVFNDVMVTEDTDIEIKVASVNGTDDDDNTNDAVTAAVSQSLANSLYLTLEITTDNYPQETSWDFKDDSGTIFASGGGYTATTLYTEDITVPDNGCFTFNIYDSYGDGICCSYGLGSYKLLDPDGNVLFEGGAFESEFTEAFGVDGATSVQELDEVTSLNVFPNPVNDNLNVQFNLTESMSLDVTVFNTLGQQVDVVSSQDFNMGNHTLNVDVSDFSDGVYYVRFSNGAKQLTSKFTVLK